MRQLEVGSGGVLLLNQRPYFVRGVGDCNVEPLTGILAADKQVYIERWSMAKRYGFNGARFLGHTPAREVFEAADEVGFLIQCEGEVYGPGKGLSGWPTLTASLSPAATSFQYLPSHVVPLLKNRSLASPRPIAITLPGMSGVREMNFSKPWATRPNPIWMDYIQYATTPSENSIPPVSLYLRPAPPSCPPMTSSRPTSTAATWSRRRIRNIPTVR